uniref:PPM-type phosphatase domain-containing protein n=1 Tax=Ditylenchus dipsaci TaxID=166011 RepID=A0A915EGL0_9BILA
MELEEIDLKDPAWANSSFLVVEKDCDNSGESGCSNGTEQNDFGVSSNNYWVRQRVTKEGTEIYAFLLLSEFGEGKLVTKYVADKLVPSILDSNELTNIVKALNEDPHLHDIDNKVTDLIKSLFLRVDNECYEALQMLQIQNEEDTFDSFLFLNSGCSAILALVLQNRLYMANCGNSVGVFGKIIGDGLMVFQVSETHEEVPEGGPNVSEDNPDICLGDYGRKTEVLQNRQSAVSSEPFVIDGKIELNQTARFMLLIPPSTFKVLGRLYPEQQSLEQTNTPVSVLSKMIVDALEDSSRSPRASTQQVLKELSDKFWSQYSNDFEGQARPELCLAYIDLSNDYEVDALKESHSNAHLSAKNPKGQGLEASASSSSVNGATTQANGVTSYVDWSEFYTHELRDTVLAKIESIKQLYRERNKLTSIAEN